MLFCGLSLFERDQTSTADYLSGSVEEIEKHIKTGNPTMLYFSSQPIRIDSVDQCQYNELQQFKESCSARGLYEIYDNLDEFKNKFSRHLQTKLNEHEMFKNNNPIPISEIRQSNIGIPILSDVAKILLKEMSFDTHGKLKCMNYLGGISIGTRCIIKFGVDNFSNNKT